MAVRVEAGPKLAGAATQLDGQQAPACVQVFFDVAPCRYLGQPMRLEARATRPCRVSAGKLPALPGNV